MNREELLSIYTSSSLIKDLTNNLKKIKNINGLSGSQLSFIASSIDQTNQIDQFYIFQNKETALLFKNDFENLGNKIASLFLLNKNNSDKEISQNTKTLYEINSKKRNTLVSYKNAIEQKIPDNTNFKNRVLNLSVNFKINTEEFIESLYEYNFENLDNKLACIALPCVKSENNSETVFNNKKLAYKIEDPKIDAKIISLIKPNPFLIKFEQNK